MLTAFMLVYGMRMMSIYTKRHTTKVKTVELSAAPTIHTSENNNLTQSTYDFDQTSDSIL